MTRIHKTLAAVCLSFLAAACSPKHDNAQQQNANGATATANQNAGAFENGPNFRVACDQDIQKFCANDPRKRRCLRDNMDKLSETCKTAVNAPRNPNDHHAGIGRICADDMQKFCANDPHRVRCLRDNLAQLSAPCRAAVIAPREGQQGNTQPASGNP
jgi:hypothetical protein